MATHALGTLIEREHALLVEPTAAAQAARSEAAERYFVAAYQVTVSADWLSRHDAAFLAEFKPRNGGQRS